MTDGRAREWANDVLKMIRTTDGLIAIVGIATLIIGILLGSLVGRIICGVIFLAVCGYLYRSWRAGGNDGRERGWETEEELYSQSPEGSMKKLLFDDFQSSGARYVVKEIHEEERAVVPSTKTVQPVSRVAKEDKPPEFSIGDFFDLNSDIFRSDAEPQNEFHFLLGKTLQALKEVLFAHSVAYFWVNGDKKQLVLEARSTDSQNFIQGKRLSIGSDVISQVAENGKPQVLGRMNPVTEKELIHYYESPEYVKSFVGVPVYYFKGSQDAAPVGVIVADSKAEDAFGAETFALLGNFTKLVSALIKSYTEKYDLLLESELLTSIRRLQDRVKSSPTEETILTALGEEVNRLLNWDSLTITMYSEERRGWVIQKVINKSGHGYIGVGDHIDFQDSIVGKTIRTNHVQSIKDLSGSGMVRFSAGERIELKGSLVSVPISSINRCYGALTLESADVANFGGIEVETVYRLVENAAASLEVLYMNDMVKEFVIVDQLTGSMTKKHFMKKLEDEVQRADDFGAELTFLSLAVDDKQLKLSRYGNEGFETILSQVAKVVRANTRPYDIIGRWDDDMLGILLVNTAASDGYLWAEKVRKLIAGHIISLDHTSISVTVSAGVCGMSEGMKKEQLIAGTSQVLHKAIEDGGNLVRVY